MSVSWNTAAFGKQNRPYYLRDAHERVYLSESPIPWFDDIRQRLEKLLKLELGWDGYSAPPISFDNAYFALSMLEKICTERTSTPQIVPGVSGDLQVEWHTTKGDIELHVRAPNDVRAWIYEDSMEDEGVELSLRNDFTTVAQWVREIAEDDVALEAAAA